MKCQVLIAGAGPSGLGAALLLHTLGWRDIVVVEKRPADHGFDRGRAFNYQLEGRGQRLLERVGISPERIAHYGLANDHFTLTKFTPDGESKMIQPPILVPGRKTPYWMTRTRMLEMLHEALQPVLDQGAVTLLDGHTFSGFTHNASGYQAQVLTRDADTLTITPKLVLGCDGLGSEVRRGLARLSRELDARMQRTTHPSPAANLKYKVLNFPSKFAVNNGNQQVDDHAMAYAFVSNYRDRDRRMALFALPVASPEDPRSINIILPQDHFFWSLNTAGEITAFLQAGFPQLNIASVAGAKELEDFAQAPQGQFPQPQYTQHIYAALERKDEPLHCVLVGDAAHAFPPDLGMGVNSALEDLTALEPYLDRADLGQAMTDYAAEREPEHAALVRLVQRVHPYQYNQIPWRLKLWSLRFLLQLGLHRLTGGLIEMPGFMLSQLHAIPFTEIERRFRSGNIAMRGMAAGVVGLAAFALL